MMDFLQNINELPIESPYGSIKDPWVTYAFAATQLRAILVTVHDRLTSTGNLKADEECAARRKAQYRYQTVHATGYDAN